MYGRGRIGQTEKRDGVCASFKTGGVGQGCLRIVGEPAREGTVGLSAHIEKLL